MIKYKVYIKAFLFALILIGLFGFANYKNETRKIIASEIVFENGEGVFITKNEVNGLLVDILGNIKNVKKKKIALRILEKQIEKNDMVKKAEVYVTVDGVLKTKVFEKKPIARVLVNKAAYYIDSNGNKMNLSRNHSARVPVVTGVMGNDDVKIVYQFVNAVLKDSFMKQQIIGINLRKHVFFDLKTRMGNQLIEFGKLENVDKKIKKLKAFYQKMNKDKSIDKYRKINVEYSKQVVCTK